MDNNIIQGSSTVTGTTTLTGTLSVIPTVYVTNGVYIIRNTSTNTGAVTINLNSLGARSVKKYGPFSNTYALVDLAAGEFTALTDYYSTYDGTQFVVQMLPYKKYKANLTQAGVAAPTDVVLESTLGGTPVWAYSATGVYTITLTGAFPTASKVSISFGILNTTPGISDYAFLADVTSANVITLRTYSSAVAGTLADAVLNNTTIKIEVYP